MANINNVAVAIAGVYVKETPVGLVLTDEGHARYDAALALFVGGYRILPAGDEIPPMRGGNFKAVAL